MKQARAIPLNFTSPINGMKFGEVNKKNLCHYSPLAKDLSGSQQAKALNFVHYDCIKWNEEEQVYNCLPLEGYNKTIYTIERINGVWECNCQFYQKVVKRCEAAACSHLLAMKLWLDLKEKGLR